MKTSRVGASRAGLYLSLFLVVAAGVWSSPGCGAVPDENPFGEGGTQAGSSTSTGDGGNGGDDLPPRDGGFDAGDPCENLECQVVGCGGGATTAVTGTVYAPTPPQYGAPDPIYNALVYVPNA